MNTPSQQPWFSKVILIGLLYCVIGIVFALPSNQVRMWRLAAWVMSAVVYAAHVGYEHFRLRNASQSTALHVAVAVGIGGFALAVAATIHSLFAPPNYTRWRFALALVVWPIVTGLPAFVVALVVAAVLARFQPRRLAE